MKAVPPNSPLEPFVRSRIYGSGKGHSMMKRGVKNRDLRDAPQKTLHDLNTFEFRSIMKGSEDSSVGDHALHFMINDDRLLEFVLPKHDTMPDHANLGWLFDRRDLAFPQ